MTDTVFPELQALRIELTDEVRDAQFLAIVEALAETPVARPSRWARARMAWRRWVVSVAAVGTALVPVGAVASESAVPGDVLYPLKLTVERVQLLFDRDIDAEHRVDELERLVERDAPTDVVDRHIAETLDVLLDTVERADLRLRFDRVVDDHRITDDPPAGTATGDGAEAGEPDRPPTDSAPTDDRPDTTTTTAHDSRGDVVDETTTTTVHRDADRATDTTEPAPPDRDGTGDETTTETDPPREDSGDGAGDRP